MCPATALDNPKGKPPPSYQGQFGRVDGTAQHISPKDSTNLVVVDGVVVPLLLFLLAPLARSRSRAPKQSCSHQSVRDNTHGYATVYRWVRNRGLPAVGRPLAVGRPVVIDG